MLDKNKGIQEQAKQAARNLALIANSYSFSMHFTLKIEGAS
ncbi:MAG: hypothetical protein K0S27_37 [Gammaproteobacteria bacterium]|nr:hypothetical protein [Gammaproteobacteria bacterium]